MAWLGLSFYQFVEYVSSGRNTGLVERPDGIEAFLPISGLLGTASWLKGGGINSIHPSAVVVFITVLVLSLLMRRSFCSWICPVATISELSWKSGFSFFRRNWRLPHWLDVSFRSIKYLLFALFGYSIAIAMSPEALVNFIQSDYHKLADVRLMDFFLHISPLALGIIVGLFALSFVLKNPFCRYLCPYGALLGIFAMFSPLRVTRNIERCVSCGVCSQSCPSFIDVMHKSSVASPECIGCWRCVSHCRFNNALSMRAFGSIYVSGIAFALMVVLLFWGGTRLGKLTGHWHSSLSLDEYVRLLVKEPKGK
jgi:polyferredoxin